MVGHYWLARANNLQPTPEITSEISSTIGPPSRVRGQGFTPAAIRRAKGKNSRNLLVIRDRRLGALDRQFRPPTRLGQSAQGRTRPFRFFFSTTRNPDWHRLHARPGSERKAREKTIVRGDFEKSGGTAENPQRPSSKPPHGVQSSRSRLSQTFLSQITGAGSRASRPPPISAKAWLAAFSLCGIGVGGRTSELSAVGPPAGRTGRGLDIQAILGRRCGDWDVVTPPTMAHSPKNPAALPRADVAFSRPTGAGAKDMVCCRNKDRLLLFPRYPPAARDGNRSARNTT